MQSVKGQGRAQYLRRRIGICGVEAQPGARAGVELQLRAMRQRTIHVDVLSQKCSCVETEINQVAKGIVKIGARQRRFAAKQRLVKTGFPSAVLLGPQMQVWNDAKAFLAKRFFEARLLDAC